MSKTLVINLLSGPQENEDTIFALKLTEACLKAGHNVNIFLNGKSCAYSLPEKKVDGDTGIAANLQSEMDKRKLSEKFAELAAKGAKIATCHTSEYARGILKEPYSEGVHEGDLGDSYVGFLMNSDVHLSIGH
jgi:sulfur relay (sulfurtransferase) complex TusBCD TusD component (DsrE family)